tara:strand:- start:153 stop:608 length:456 start_codon:yes stop_codon:yes gene_type:complete
MARTSKSRGASPFAMKSGNKTTFKMMGSTSPMRKDPASYQATLDKVTANMTDAELRDIVVKQHGGKASKFNVSLNTLKKIRRSMQPKETTENVEKPAETKTKTPSDSDEMQEYVISNEDQERIFAKHGGGVLEGDALAARNKDLRDATARY